MVHDDHVPSNFDDKMVYWCIGLVIGRRYCVYCRKCRKVTVMWHGPLLLVVTEPCQAEDKYPSLGARRPYIQPTGKLLFLPTNVGHSKFADFYPFS